MFGSAGWRGKIYSQGMVNKYCSPQQEGPHSLTSGREGRGERARACNACPSLPSAAAAI